MTPDEEAKLKADPSAYLRRCMWALGFEVDPSIQRDCTAAAEAVIAENAKLTTRRDELLATIARISQSTPLDSEVAEALEQRGKLLAEVGTLRAQLGEAERERRRLSDLCQKDLDENTALDEANCALTRQLAAMTKARDEACDIAKWGLNGIAGEIGEYGVRERRARLAELRKVGAE